MSEMVERVGKAFFTQFQKYGGHTTWENLSDDARHIWMRELIPTVIEAMREPTEAMVLSGAKELAEEDQWDRLGELPREYLRVDARAVYDAMINEALKT